MACTTGCPTPGAHKSWGQCMRAKSLRIGYAHSAAGLDLSKQKRWDSRLQEWRDARRQGIKPASSRLPDIREAVKRSNDSGKAYRAY